MITKLDNSDEQVATRIYAIFQASYQVEAQLIGVVDFPPLSRSVKDIENSSTDFYGFIENNCIAAIAEIDIEDRKLTICSLAVEPKYFRQGVGSKLVGYVLDTFEFSEAVVETAVVNMPAIKLYGQHGFVEFRRWTPSHGIEKIAMSLF